MTRSGRFHVPGQYVRSLYVDQVPDNDLSREVARDHGIRLTRSVADALTAHGVRISDTFRTVRDRKMRSRH